jgi:hypothetical protein
MVATAVVLALWGGLFHSGAPHHGPGDQYISRSRVDHWRLEVRDDRFTGVKTCVLRRSRMTYVHGVVTFRLGDKVDTANALFRLDNGVVHTAGSVAVRAAGLGARFSSPNLNNPSGGEVHIPADDLRGVRMISIQANPRTWHQNFDLRGFDDALAAAGAKGCALT